MRGKPVRVARPGSARLAGSDNAPCGYRAFEVTRGVRLRSFGDGSRGVGADSSLAPRFPRAFVVDVVSASGALPGVGLFAEPKDIVGRMAFSLLRCLLGCRAPSLGAVGWVAALQLVDLTF